MANLAPKKPHVAGILGALVAVAGIVTRPEILGILPANYADIIAGAGLVWQGVTKAVHHGDTDVVPKS